MPLKGLNNVKQAIDKVVENLNDDVTGVYLAGLKNIVEGTPARKGVARNNWFLSEGSPSGVFRNAPSVGGSASLNSILRGMPDSVLSKTLYFTNNTPYINVLEYGGYPNPVKYGSYFDGRFQKLSSGGYSKQAPGGFARKSIKLMQAKIRTL